MNNFYKASIEFERTLSEPFNQEEFDESYQKKYEDEPDNFDEFYIEFRGKNER